MSERLSFIVGRALPLGVFGFLVAIQGELAVAGLQQAFRGELNLSESMYLLNRILTLGFFAFLLAIYLIRSKAVARDHNPVAVVAALVGSFILYGLFLVPSQPRSTNVWVLALSDICLATGMIWALYSLTYLRNRFSIVPEARGLGAGGVYELVPGPLYVGGRRVGIGAALPIV